MAAGTLASRLTGLLRTAALAGLLGVGVVADAFNAASAVPTMLLVLVTGGTLSAALVPLLSRAEQGTAYRHAVSTVLLAVGCLAGVAALALALTAPVVARVLSLGDAGSTDEAERLRILTVLIVLFAPQVLLLALTAVTGALLTERGRLGQLGWAPVGSNLAFLALLALYPWAVSGGNGEGRGVPLAGLLVLGSASTGAAAVGCLLQLRALRDVLPPWTELRQRPQAHVLRQLRSTGSATLLYVVANQIGLITVLSVGAAQTGTVSAYTWSFTVMQLPHALITVTVLSATLPRLARAAGDAEQFARLLRSTTTVVMLLLLPAAVGLALFSDLAAALLTGWGAASGTGQGLVGQGVGLFALALLPFTLFQVLTRTCYALDRPAWPAFTNVAATAVLVSGALLVKDAPGARELLTGLVLSYTASYVIGCLLLVVALARHGRPPAVAWQPLLAVALAVLLGAAVVVFLRRSLSGGWPAALAELCGYALIVGAALLLRGNRVELLRRGQ